MRLDLLKTIFDFILNLFRKKQKPAEVIIPKPVINKVKTEYIIDGIEYNSQRDNKLNPLIACNVTSTQMFMQNLFSKNNCPSDDDLMLYCNSDEMVEWAKKHIGSWTLQYSNKRKLNQVHAVLAKAVNDFAKAEICFATNGITIEKIKNEIKEGNPVVLGGSFTKGGHMVCCVGYNQNGLIIHDPYGDWNTNYKNHNGEYVLYKFSDMELVLSGNGIMRR